MNIKLKWQVLNITLSDLMVSINFIIMNLAFSIVIKINTKLSIFHRGFKFQRLKGIRLSILKETKILNSIVPIKILKLIQNSSHKLLILIKKEKATL